MRFYLRKRRQAPVIIVVALIDILIVLLIFLMVTTSFNRQPALKVALPESALARKAGANQTSALVITIERKGNLGLGPDAKPVTLASLRQQLVNAVGNNPDLVVDIYSDSNSTVGLLVNVMDAVRGANIRSLHLKTRMPGEP